LAGAEGDDNMTTWNRESMQHLIARRDSCSGGRAAGCTTCGLRHTCGLDEAAEVATQALRGFSALHELAMGIRAAERGGPDCLAARALIRQSMTASAILREIEWEDADDED
jgi:hypothetical protein